MSNELKIRMSPNVEQMLKDKGVSNLSELERRADSTYPTIHAAVRGTKEPRLQTTYDILLAAGFDVREINEMKMGDVFVCLANIPF